mgnify:CR=1 FL=1
MGDVGWGGGGGVLCGKIGALVLDKLTAIVWPLDSAYLPNCYAYFIDIFSRTIVQVPHRGNRNEIWIDGNS